MLEILFTALLNSVRGIARIFGYEISIVLTEHKIETKFDHPKREGNLWDSDHWLHGNIFLEGYANPIKPTKDDLDEDAKVITSDRYESWMEQSVIEDMLKVGRESDMTIRKLMFIIAGLNVLLVGIVYWLTTTGL